MAFSAENPEIETSTAATISRKYGDDYDDWGIAITLMLLLMMFEVFIYFFFSIIADGIEGQG